MNEGTLADELETISGDRELLEIGRRAIENELIEWRNDRLSTLNRGNGLVIKEKDGKESSVIRFGPEDALRIGLRAIAKAKREENNRE